MRKVSMRRKSLTLAAVAAVMAPAAIGFVSPLANAATVTPTTREGNPTCVDLGYDYGFKPATADGKQNVPGTYTDSATDIKVTFTGGTPQVGWESTVAPAAVLVKGGPRSNEYVYNGSTKSDTDLEAPKNDGGNVANLSHLEFCFNYNLDVTKTASTSFDRTYGWTVEKSAAEQALTLSAGQVNDLGYSVKATRDAGTDSNWAVAGTITLTNPWPKDASSVSVTDVLAGKNVAVDCKGITTVPAKGG